MKMSRQPLTAEIVIQNSFQSFPIPILQFSHTIPLMTYFHKMRHEFQTIHISMVCGHSMVHVWSHVVWPSVGICSMETRFEPFDILVLPRAPLPSLKSKVHRESTCLRRVPRCNLLAQRRLRLWCSHPQLDGRLQYWGPTAGRISWQKLLRIQSNSSVSLKPTSHTTLPGEKSLTMSSHPKGRNLHWNLCQLERNAKQNCLQLHYSKGKTEPESPHRKEVLQSFQTNLARSGSLCFPR